MSDPMTNVEIEDVLSSIRRLVAETEPDRPDATPPAARLMPKLVLTPAQRVDSPAATPDRAAPVLLSESQRITAAEPVVQNLPDAASGADRASLLSTIAELEAAVRDQIDDWEPDGTGTDTDLSWARAGFRGDVDVEDAEDLQPRSAPANAAAWPPTLIEAARRYGGDDMADPADDDGSGPVAEFRHHRSENLARPDEPDGDFNDDLIGGPALGDNPEDTLDSYLAAQPVIDEADMREMVRDIVRQELQGKLGERITRNVRKLVRREIHRALTTQNFD